MPGYCTECRRIRQVLVSGHGLALARGGVVSGICQECEDEQDRKRKERRR